MKASVLIVGLSLTLLVAGLDSGNATTIRAVSLDEMLQQAEFIFEGKVTAVEVRARAGAATLETCASFEILEILKGSTILEPLELCFAGGVRGFMRRQIHRMVYPVAGERGIYFVASLDERYVHPLYGWNQGYFRIRDAATETAEAEVHTAGGEAIVDVESRPDPEFAGLSTGVAHGMVTQRSRAASLGRMTPQAFKGKLREMLKEHR